MSNNRVASLENATYFRGFFSTFQGSLDQKSCTLYVLVTTNQQSTQQNFTHKKRYIEDLRYIEREVERERERERFVL